MERLKRILATVCLGLAFSIAGLAQPVITKSFSPAVIAPGGSTTLTIAITNPTGAAINPVTVTDNLPPGISAFSIGAIVCPSPNWQVNVQNFTQITIGVDPLPV